MPFAADFRASLGRPSSELLAKLDRGVLTNDSHYIQLSDQQIIEPLPITMTMELLDAEVENQLAALSNIFRDAPWQVGNQTWTNTNETTQILNGDGVLVNTPATADPTEDRVNIEIKQLSKSTPPLADVVFVFQEVHFPRNQEFNEAPEGNVVTLNGLWYGDIVKNADFTTGTDTTA